MRSMTVIVHRIAVVVDEVVAVDVAGESVLARVRIDPHVRGQIGMRVINSAVDDGDDGVAGPGGDVPRRRGTNVTAGAVPFLTGIVEAPLIAKLRVIRDGA